MSAVFRGLPPFLALVVALASLISLNSRVLHRNWVRSGAGTSKRLRAGHTTPGRLPIPLALVRLGLPSDKIHAIVTVDRFRFAVGRNEAPKYEQEIVIREQVR